MSEAVTEQVVQPDATTSILQQRLAQLEERRRELVLQLEKELQLALQPIDASIKEVRFLISQIEGTTSGVPDYQLFKRSPTVQQQAPQQMFQPARQAARPPVEVVLSPKTNTPVPTNISALRQAMGKSG